MKKDSISIVIPVYGDKNLVKKLYDELIKVFSLIDADFEIIMVNDACPYGSGEEIEKLALEDKRVKFIDLSRNFGQHYAIKAGIDNANGDYVVVMDCDLQDNPKDIVKFYAKIKEGFDIVFGIRIQRKDTFFKKLCSNTAAFITNTFTDYSLMKNQGNFSIFSKKVLFELKNCNEQNFVFSTVLAWLGFDTAYIEIEQEQRAYGNSGYNFLKGIKHFIYILISNSNKPLVFAAFCAFLMFLASFLFCGKLLFEYYLLGHKAVGWTSIMLALFFISGLIFAYLSLLGLYIGQIARGIKNRPLYSIKRRVNL